MIYDLAIVGGGPAGLSAAVTAKNRNLSTVLFDPAVLALRCKRLPISQITLAFPTFQARRSCKPSWTMPKKPERKSYLKKSLAS